MKKCAESGLRAAFGPAAGAGSGRRRGSGESPRLRPPRPPTRCGPALRITPLLPTGRHKAHAPLPGVPRGPFPLPGVPRGPFPPPHRWGYHRAPLLRSQPDPLFSDPGCPFQQKAWQSERKRRETALQSCRNVASASTAMTWAPVMPPGLTACLPRALRARTPSTVPQLPGALGRGAETQHDLFY